MQMPRALSFLRERRTALLSVFLAAEVAVLLFVLAENAWPREVPEVLGWAIYLGSYPWSLPWADGEDPPVTMIAIAASFGANVVIASAIVWGIVGRMKRS